VKLDFQWRPLKGHLILRSYGIAKEAAEKLSLRAEGAPSAAKAEFKTMHLPQR
jgi:hypothetical protein